MEGSKALFKYGRFEIEWGEDATVKINDEGFTVVVDPSSKVSEEFEADLIFVTSGEENVYDPKVIEKVSYERTCVVVPESIDKEEIPCRDVESIDEDGMIDVFGVEIEGTPTGKGSKGIGYRFMMKDTEFFVAGDTGLIEQFLDLEGRVDLAFLPLDGEKSMDVDEAVKAAARIKPEAVLPYRYGGSQEKDLRTLKNELERRNIGCKID